MGSTAQRNGGGRTTPWRGERTTGEGQTRGCGDTAEGTSKRIVMTIGTSLLVVRQKQAEDVECVDSRKRGMQRNLQRNKKVCQNQGQTHTHTNNKKGGVCALPPSEWSQTGNPTWPMQLLIQNVFFS